MQLLTEIRLIIRASARSFWALRSIAERLCETMGSLLLRLNGEKLLSDTARKEGRRKMEDGRRKKEERKDQHL